MRLPQPEGQGGQTGQELATLDDGRTVVVLFDGHLLPDDQPAAIKASIEVLPTPLPEDLKRAISGASPHVRLINERVVERIRTRYSAEQEIALLRGQPSEAYKAYNVFVEECRAWGTDQKAALGLRSFDDAKRQAVADVHREHDQIILSLTGNPTEAERGSWTVKLNLARDVLAGRELDDAQKWFLTARGISTNEQIKAYAQQVMKNNTAYSAIVGLADKVRSNTLARIAAATPETWAAVGEQNRQERNDAMAAASELLKG